MPIEIHEIIIKTHIVTNQQQDTGKSNLSVKEKQALKESIRKQIMEECKQLLKEFQKEILSR